jgi:hypothetical protein
MVFRPTDYGRTLVPFLPFVVVTSVAALGETMWYFLIIVPVAAFWILTQLVSRVTAALRYRTLP